MIKFVGQNPLLPHSQNNITQSSIEDCVEYCKNKKVLGVDTETEGFDFLTKQMIMFQIGDEKEQFVIDTRTVSIEPLRQILESNEITKIFHNAKFDYKFIKRWSNIEVENIFDTYLSEKILHCGKPDHGYSLTACTERYLDISLNKEERNKFVSQESKPFTHFQIEYGAKDVEYLISIRKKQVELLHANNLQDVAALENMVTKVLSEIEYEGIRLDKGKWLDLANENKHKATKLLRSIDEVAAIHPKLKEFTTGVQFDMFLPQEEQRLTTINWDSPLQVQRVFKKLIPKLEDVNANSLFKYRYKHNLIEEYLKYKEISKLYTTYGEAFFKYIKSDDKVHTQFQQILNTGRMSSSEPNMQQIPSDNRYRNCFICPEDYVFVSSDYSSQELNVIAYGSKDPVFLNALQNNEDLHSVCADLVFQDKWTKSALPDCRYIASKQKCNCPEHKKLRTQVKSINFGLAYGMGPHKLADQLDIKLNEASELINKYFDAFPSIKTFLDKLGRYGRTHGYITTFKPFRRKRFFPEWDGPRTTPKDSSMIERASKNTPIQGSSADMTKLALIKIHDYIKSNQLEKQVKIVMTVHDQIDTICHKKLADEWSKVLTELMEEAANTIITNKLLKAETEISEVWKK